MDDLLNQLKQRLTAYLSSVTNAPAEIHHAQPIAGGASRDTWVIDATIGAERQKLVLRRDLPSVMYEQALTREQEYKVIDAAYQNGVLAPRPRFLCNDASVLGQPFFIM